MTGTTRSPERAAAIRAAGANAIVVNVFDAQRLGDAIDAARPVVIVHQLTDLPDHLDPTRVSDTLARETRAFARKAPATSSPPRCARGLAAWSPSPSPGPTRPGRSCIDEDGALDTGAEGIRHVTIQGVVELERLVTSVPRLEGVVLRYGQLYGPGTWNAAPAGNAPVHVDAAARAAALAVARGEPGVYNIVEDGGAASNAKARARLGWEPGPR